MDLDYQFHSFIWMHWILYWISSVQGKLTFFLNMNPIDVVNELNSEDNSVRKLC